MKRIRCILLAAIFVFGLAGCVEKPSAVQTQEAIRVPDSWTEVEESWTEQDVLSLYARAQEANWEYVDCTVISDHASDRVGAVLFRDETWETSNVAFFDRDGHYQVCGISADIPESPDFSYLGNGMVICKLEAEDGAIYNYTITITTDEGNVSFTVKSEGNGGKSVEKE